MKPAITTQIESMGSFGLTSRGGLFKGIAGDKME